MVYVSAFIKEIKESVFTDSFCMENLIHKDAQKRYSKHR